MADTNLYENRYRRYLEDDTDTYLKPERSTTEKVIMGGIAAVGVVGGGYLAFKHGALKDLMHSTISQAGKFRRNKVNAFNDAIRTWSQDDGLDGLSNGVRQLIKRKPKDAIKSGIEWYRAMGRFKDHMNNGFREHEERMKKLGNSQLRDTEVELQKRHSERKAMEDRLYKSTKDDDVVLRAKKVFDQDYLNLNDIQKKEQDLKTKQTGFRFATVRDLIEGNHVNKDEEWIQEGITLAAEKLKNKKKGEEYFLNKVADRSILIDEKKKLADLRDFQDNFSGFVHSLTTEFTIPLVKINPLRMFYLDHFFSNIHKPMFHISTSDTKNPVITGHNGVQGQAYAYSDGKIYDLYHQNEAGKLEAKELEGNYFLADAQKGPIARLLRNMSGISISKFTKPDDKAPFLTRAKYHLGSFFDVGLQDEPGGQADIFDPTSWVTGLINVVTGRMKQTQYVERPDYLTDAFGKDKDFIYMRSHKTLQESDGIQDYLNQFAAGRNRLDKDGKIIENGRGMKDVTLSTMFPYGFFERLNATLNQVNLGLSNKALGSAFDVFGNLMLKRVAPIWAGVELWDYLNYESENLLGVQFEDRFAQMYKNSSLDLAMLRDNLGVTNWAKGISPLIAGGEQIADIPFLGHLLDLNDTEEETKDYWENGEDPVRKGRWWGMGNTPYTGAKIDHYEPNWVRRTLADVKFSESQYGSRDEYFANSWLPSLHHPLAPLRHFLTDQYHWEEKHYQDRPYMVTGGIPELENFPLLGPLLNATIGQILKPQRMMHPEAWKGSGTDAMGQDVPMLQSIENGTVQEAQQGRVGASIDGDGNVQFQPASGSAQPASDAIQTAAGTTQTAPEPVSAPINTRGTGYGGIAAGQQAADEALFSYVTSGGAVQLLRGDEGATVEDALSVMAARAPQATGKFRMERMPLDNTDPQDALPQENPMQFNQLLGTLHYNMTEMGGFYGFMNTSFAGEIGDEAPVIESSSEMTGYTRAFWDKDIGGFGGDANEIFRRFLPADRKLNTVNPVANTMPNWLPGGDYFIDFQTGDPYTKLKKGESRLPGEGYERLYNIDSEKMLNMDIGASFIGYDEKTIRDHILKNDAYKEEAFMKILDGGSKIHAQMEKDLLSKGVAESSEEYVSDDNTKIGGFYDLTANNTKLLDWALKQNIAEFKLYQNPHDDSGKKPSEKLGGFYEELDMLKLDENSRNEGIDWLKRNYGDQSATIDIKTRGANAWKEEGMHFENVQQLNFYATQKGTPMNYFIEVNRQDPSAGIKIFGFQQSPELLKYTTDKVQHVREGLNQEMQKGTLSRGDLYSIIDRYRILADAAPYSTEFRDMKAMISSMGLSEDESKEVSLINKQVSSRKITNRMYQYKFSTANIDNEMVTVDHVIDNNTFVSVEHPDNPIKFAGVRISTAKDNPVADQAQEFISKTVREGEKVRVAYDADDLRQVKDDTYKSIQAVVYDHRGLNMNRYLIEHELGKEKQTDFSPASVHARFSSNEIQFGSLWEKFSHMDTILHTKLLQVRSPLESYERREVYGKDWQEWTDPIDDFLIPAIQNSAVHNPVLAIASGGFIGMAFGSLKPTDIGGEKVMGRYGKIVGGFIGASIMGMAVLNRMVEEAVTGKAWIPERRKKERDTEEYFDALKYIKYNSLFEKYASQALKREGFNVRDYVHGSESKGEDRKKQRKDLADIKRQIYKARPNQLGELLGKLRRDYGIEAHNRDEALKAINKQGYELQNHREIQELKPLSAQALKYYQASKQTMYGYEPGDPIANVLGALPKKDREYLTPFIKAPEEERDRILEIAPNYMKRVLQSAWGMPVDEKLPMQQYFNKHPLPGANWKGWREDTSLDDIKVKFVDQVGLDPSEFNIWDDDKRRAKELNVQAPNVFDGRESAESYSTKIKEILKGFDVQGVKLDIIDSDMPGLHVDMNIRHDRRDDVQRIINQEGQHVL